MAVRIVPTTAAVFKAVRATGRKVNEWRRQSSTGEAPATNRNTRRAGCPLAQPDVASTEGDDTRNSHSQLGLPSATIPLLSGRLTISSLAAPHHHIEANNRDR